MPGDIVVGLDIGSTRVRTVVAETTDDPEPEIIGCASIACEGLRQGVVVDMDRTADAIRQCVDRAARMAKVDIRSVMVGVSGQHISSLNSRGVLPITNPGREITEEDRLRVIEESKAIVLPPDRRILHCIPRQYAVDGQQGILRPVNMAGSRLEVESHVITAANTFVENVLRCVAQAKLAVESGEDGVVFSGLASSEAVLSADERDQGVVMADIGGGVTDVAVFSKGTIYHSAVIPIGGEHVTNDIAVGLRLSHHEADRVKHQEGSAIAAKVAEDAKISVTRIAENHTTVFPKRLLAEIIEPRLDEILGLVKEEVERYGGNLRLPAGLVLTGGGSQLPDSAELAHRIMDWPVRVGLPVVSGPAQSQVLDPSYSTAVGLVRRAVARRAREARGTADGHLLGGLGRAVRSLFRPRRRAKKGT